MPLDDAYIHFQYARQIVHGEPYVYNPSDTPTSGATSFIYPYLLAIGYALGFTGLDLGFWATGIGALALLASTWLVVRLARIQDAPMWLATALGIAFALSGPMAWHSMSGMETGLVITFVLATLYGFVAQRRRLFIASATLLALTRPEGSIMAAIAVVVMGLTVWKERRFSVRQEPESAESWSGFLLLWLALPLAAILVQPAVNWIVTGSPNASGTMVKSIFSTIPFHWDDVLARIWENWVRMWHELFTGTNGEYTPVIVAPLALIGLVRLFGNARTSEVPGDVRPQKVTGLLLLGWFFVVSAGVSTLDTAFWHFKRYQMPLIALLYPLAAGGGMALWSFARRHARTQRGVLVQYISAALVLVGLIGLTFPTSLEFLRLYAVNVDNMMAQPLPMARWLNQNTPKDAVVAVHDVGLMRYIGERYTIDMVGLTTPGAAEAWRNGPGAVAEFLMSHDPLPDYVAAYTTVRGLNYLVDAGIYGELLAGFPAEYAPEDNVALAAEFQGIYLTDWTNIRFRVDSIQTGIADPFLIYGEKHRPLYEGFLDVANLTSETRANYQWSDYEQGPGFVTEVYNMYYIDCWADDCRVLDSGRLINDEEEFTLSAGYYDSGPRWDVRLVTRLHPAQAGTIDIYANGVFIATRWIPAIPGQWLEVATVIPAEIATDNIRFRIVPHIPDGHYMPYTHWIYGSSTEFEAQPALATYQDGAIQLIDVSWDQHNDGIDVSLAWQTDGSAEGDYKLFVHLYDDIDSPPVAQTDMYPGNGTLPPGNWLPGTRADTIAVNMAGVSSGTYQIALGFYNPYTMERLMPIAIDDSVWVDENSRRLFIGAVEVSDDG